MAEDAVACLGPSLNNRFSDFFYFGKRNTIHVRFDPPCFGQSSNDGIAQQMRLAEPATVSKFECLKPPYVGVTVDSVICLFLSFHIGVLNNLLAQKDASWPNPPRVKF